MVPTVASKPESDEEGAANGDSDSQTQTAETPQDPTGAETMGPNDQPMPELSGADNRTPQF